MSKVKHEDENKSYLELKVSPQSFQVVEDKSPLGFIRGGETSFQDEDKSSLELAVNGDKKYSGWFECDITEGILYEYVTIY